MPSKIHVPMPETQMYQRAGIQRDELVEKFGETTVTRAETASILNILFVSGAVRPGEFIDIMVQQCRRIEAQRAEAARVDME